MKVEQILSRAMEGVFDPLHIFQVSNQFLGIGDT